MLTKMWMDAKQERTKTDRKHTLENEIRTGSNVRYAGRKAVHALKVLLTFLYVNATWIFFRAPSLKEAFGLFRTIFSFQFGKINWNLAGCFNLDEFWYVIKVLKLDGWQYGQYLLMILILTAVLLLVFFGRNAVDFVKKVKPDAVHVVFLAVLFVWSILSFSGVSSFLYVNF